jgi:hypothetical protein
MALWFNLKINEQCIGGVEVQRREPLDLSDPSAIQHEVCTYDVFLDGCRLGSVRHRYGAGAWRLLAAAADLIAGETSPSGGTS